LIEQYFKPIEALHDLCCSPDFFLFAGRKLCSIYTRKQFNELWRNQL